MELHSRFRVPVLLLVASTITTSVSRADDERLLFDFRDAGAARQWQTVNDNVMGGVSQGRFTIRDEQTLEFFGSLSLANNGGFASVRSRSQSLNLQPDESLYLRVRGDGRKYYVDLRVPSNQIAFTYRVSIQTKADQWLQFRIPLTLFKATSFGRVISNARGVDASRVNSIGFTISDKRAGPFNLEVAWIKVVRQPSKG